MPFVPDSTQLGYLNQQGVVDNLAVHKVWHDVLVGLTGVDTNLVRMAEQVDPPPTPGKNIDWIAFKIVPSQPPYNNPEVIHVGDGDGYDVVVEHKPEEVQIYCYGPLSADVADTIRRNLFIGQNRDYLRIAGIGIESIGAPFEVAMLQNQKWYQRFDLSIRTTREIAARYEVLNILEAGGDFSIGDGGTAPTPDDPDNPGNPDGDGGSGSGEKAAGVLITDISHGKDKTLSRTFDSSWVNE